MFLKTEGGLRRSVLIFFAIVGHEGLAQAIKCNTWQRGLIVHSTEPRLIKHPILESLRIFRDLIPQFEPEDKALLESLLAIKAYRDRFSSASLKNNLKFSNSQEFLFWMNSLNSHQFDILKSMGFGFESGQLFIQSFNRLRASRNLSVEQLWETYSKALQVLDRFTDAGRHLVLSQPNIVQEDSASGIISKLADWTILSMPPTKQIRSPLRSPQELGKTLKDRLIHRYYWAQKGIYSGSLDSKKQNDQAFDEMRHVFGAFYPAASLRVRTGLDGWDSARLEEIVVRSFPELFIVKGSSVPQDLQIRILASHWEPKVKFLVYSLLELSQLQDPEQRRMRLEGARLSYRRLKVLDFDLLGEEKSQIVVFKKAEELAKIHWPQSMNSEIWEQMRNQVGGIQLKIAAKARPLIGISRHAWSPEVKEALDRFSPSNSGNGHGDKTQTERRHLENLLAFQFVSNLFHPREANGDPAILAPVQKGLRFQKGPQNERDRSVPDVSDETPRSGGEISRLLWSKEEVWVKLIEAYLDPFSSLARSQVAVLSAAQKEARIVQIFDELVEIYQNQRRNQQLRNSNGLVFSNSSELKAVLLNKIDRVVQRVRDFSRDHLDSPITHSFVVLLKNYSLAPLMGRNSLTIERLSQSDKESLSILREWSRQLIDASEIFKASHRSEERLSEVKNLMADDLILWMLGQIGIQFSQEEFPHNGDGYFDISVKLKKIEDRLKILAEDFFKPQQLAQENRAMYTRIRQEGKVHRDRRSRRH